MDQALQRRRPLPLRPCQHKCFPRKRAPHLPYVVGGRPWPFPAPPASMRAKPRHHCERPLVSAAVTSHPTPSSLATFSPNPRRHCHPATDPCHRRPYLHGRELPPSQRRAWPRDGFPCCDRRDPAPGNSRRGLAGAHAGSRRELALARPGIPCEPPPYRCSTTQSRTRPPSSTARSRPRSDARASCARSASLPWQRHGSSHQSSMLLAPLPNVSAGGVMAIALRAPSSQVRATPSLCCRPPDPPSQRLPDPPSEAS